MKRVLVLGGGGVIGVAWESGLVTGLHEAGYDLSAIDAIVGTSAGAIIGAQLAAGRRSFVTPVERVREDAQALGAAIDLSQPEAQQGMAQIFRLWAAMPSTTIEQVAAIGKIARGLHREREEAWVRYIMRSVNATVWPERRLLVAAVDTLTGERRIFERNDGVELGRAVASSAAVPGLFPSVELGGNLYMDGQTHSSTNADVVAVFKPAEVLIVMPTNSATSRGIGPHAERMLATELALLQGLGCAVVTRTPSAEEAVQFGPNLMNPRQTGAAFMAGLESGRVWAAELAQRGNP
jgi:NTE family protein